MTESPHPVPAPRVLILGGTSWLGGTIARIARDRGHHVTCLARGESGTPPDGVRHVRADRRAPEAYDTVSDADWDVVVDVTWQPALARSALAALAERAGTWVLVSSISVYADHSVPGADESAALVGPWEGDGEVGLADYAAAKVSCETACRDLVPDERLLIARAGLIAGYGDLSDRFGYWPARFAASEVGKGILVPPLSTPAQFIDVLDLAEWLVDAGVAALCGTFDAVGDQLRLRDVVEACAEVTGRQPEVVDPGEEFLLESHVAPWSGPESLPLWLPVDAYGGMVSRPGAAARLSGLRVRPLRSTVQDALRWEEELGLARPRSAGLSPAREAQLIDAWRSRGGHDG